MQSPEFHCCELHCSTKWIVFHLNLMKTRWRLNKGVFTDIYKEPHDSSDLQCWSCIFLPNTYILNQTSIQNTKTQWHSGKIAGLSVGRHGVHCSIPGRGKKGFDSSINWGNHRKPSFLTLYCLLPNGRDYFEEFHIHFISLFMLSVSSAYIKKLSFYVWATRWKEKGWRTINKNDK